MPVTKPFGTARRDLGGHLAVAAADIENTLISAQTELGDEFARPDLLRGGIRGVIRRVPPHIFLCLWQPR